MMRKFTQQYIQRLSTNTIKILKQKLSHLKFTSRTGASKIIRLKTGHSMHLKGHKSKIDPDTEPKRG